MNLMIIIGYTRPDPAAGYHPMLSGYRRGAAQQTVHLDLRGAGRPAHLDLLARTAARTSPLQWAEAVFAATNAPLELIDAAAGSALALVCTAIVEQPAARAAMRPVSVGDTLTCGGLSLACAPLGWVPLPPTTPGGVSR